MDRLPDWLQREQVTHVEVFPARAGLAADWPDWAAPEVVAAFAAAGIKAPWQHQVSAACLAHSGHDVVIATGTGSGKSLAYQLPTLSALAGSERVRVLYLAPTKALAADQHRALVSLNVPGVRPATLDGDTGREQREWVRQHANFALTNPDLLHHSLLPYHERWSVFLRQVRYVIVDECHSYRGVFGAHVSHILRRLRRLTADRPIFLLASATSGDPATSAAKLVGRPVTAIAEDTAPRGATTFALWEPPLLPGSPSPAMATPTNTAPAVTASIPRQPSASPTSAIHAESNVDARATGPTAPGAPQLRVSVDAAQPAPLHSVGSPQPEPLHSVGSPLLDAAQSTTAPRPGDAFADALLSGARQAAPGLADRRSPTDTFAGALVEEHSPAHPSAGALAGERLLPGPSTGASPDNRLLEAACANAVTDDPSLTDAPVDALADGRSPTDASADGLSWDGAVTAGWADAEPVRRSALRETGDLLADAVARGIRTLAFVPSRRGAEVVASQAKRALDEVVPGLGEQVAAYRAGYLPEERRALEQALATGELTGLATTSALELGIDVTGLDVVLLSGYPGTRSAMWQRAGRAGRAGRDALCVLIARDDPLDTYLVHHPEALFHTPIEATVFDPANPYVLAPHLCTAAAEKPLTTSDLQLFGAPRSLVDELVAQGALRARPNGWYWTHPDRPDIDLRGTGGAPISVIEASTGRLIGTAGAGSAHHHLHQGAVYTHQGRTYVVAHLDLDDGVALVEPGNPPYSTHARDVTSLDALNVRSYVDAGPVGVFLGEVEVTSQVVSFQRRRLDSGEVLGTWPLDLPRRTLQTVAVWTTLAESTLSNVDDMPGALHAAEHAAIGLLPLVASCDRWDIGGLSTVRHADTDAPTIFVYDGHPGGAGFAERAFDMAEAWLTATRDTVKSCGCEHGCPGCVQSPKCGNGNNPLDKRGAVTVLSVLLAHLDRAGAATSG